MEQIENNPQITLDSVLLKQIADNIGTTLQAHPTLEALSEFSKTTTPQQIALEIVEDGYLTLVAFTRTTGIRCEADIAFEELGEFYMWDEVRTNLYRDLKFYDLPVEEQQQAVESEYQLLYNDPLFDAKTQEDVEMDEAVKELTENNS